MGFSRAKTLAVVDVGPGGASVAIFSCPKDAAATIFSIGRSALSLEPRTPEQAAGRIAQQILEAGSMAAKLYASAGHKDAIPSVHIVLHAPWSTTNSLSAKTTFEKDAYIQSATISEVAQHALSANKNADRARLIEASVVRVLLNGYPTTEPEGKYAHELEVVSLTSECDPSLRTSVEGAVHRIFPVASIAWRSALRSVMTLSHQSHIDSEYLIIDVGADSTHMAAVHDGRIDQKVVQEGTRTLLARIAQGRMPDETLTHLRMLARDACSNETCETVQNAIASAEPELVRIFGEAIGQLGSLQKISNNVVLVCHPDMEHWLRAFFSRIDFGQFTITSMPLVIRTSQELDIGKWVAGANLLDGLLVDVALVNIESRT